MNTLRREPAPCFCPSFYLCQWFEIFLENLSLLKKTFLQSHCPDIWLCVCCVCVHSCCALNFENRCIQRICKRLGSVQVRRSKYPLLLLISMLLFPRCRNAAACRPTWRTQACCTWRLCWGWTTPAAVTPVWWATSPGPRPVSPPWGTCQSASFPPLPSCVPAPPCHTLQTGRCQGFFSLFLFFWCGSEKVWQLCACPCMDASSSTRTHTHTHKHTPVCNFIFTHQ